MGNLFIGFPVPRAKIADMIEGTAPPSLHKTQHQDGGDDELDLAGLAGAGGIDFPLRGLWIDDYYVDHARWQKQYVGSAELIRSGSKLSLKTGSTNPSNAELTLRDYYAIPTLTWDKKRHIIFQCYLDCDSHTATRIYIVSGWAAVQNHIGFEISAGQLWATNGNISAQTRTSIKSFTGPFIGEDIQLEAIHFPGVKVEFWVNSVLEETITTNIPSGLGFENLYAYIKIDNEATTNNVQLDFNHIQIYQEP